MVTMSDSECVLCPFWRESRSFTRRFCDNLRDGVPLCVVGGLPDALDDWDEEFEQACMVTHDDAELEYYFPEQFVPDEWCGCVVRGDLYDAAEPKFKKFGCFFGGLCVRPKCHGFDGCSVDCSRWTK